MRPVALSMFPDHVADKAIDYIPTSVQTGTNADLMSAIAPLYLTGSVLDVTYGLGKWWTRFTPDPFTFHDLALDGVDFRDLPETDDSFDTVAFDPPYIPSPSGGAGTTGSIEQSLGGTDLRHRFGLGEVRDAAELWELIGFGLAEASRVSRRWVLAKCGDYTSGGLTLGHRNMLDLGDDLGLVLHDLIIHTNGRPGPGGHNIFTVKRTRRAHTYLLVFRVP